MASLRPARIQVCRTVKCRCSASVHTVTLVLPSGKEAVFRAGSNRSIYDIASYAGIHLPASCKQGACSACCCKVLEGKLNSPKNSCIPPALAKEGYVTICCATPATDVKLLTHQGPAVRKWKASQT
eukprot:GHUV01014341.1.p1 GENE.GHUV01014341.1~~GHUV01014341.1.p1  ORF type:complete len:126 (+),score=18.97 GHUV01014341.1:323-700(+)